MKEILIKEYNNTPQLNFSYKENNNTFHFNFLNGAFLEILGSNSKIMSQPVSISVMSPLERKSGMILS